jgi:hypothetical protein
MQLPPVVKDRKLLKFCFQSNVWEEAGFSKENGTKFLRQVERQKDVDFVDFLNQVRVGKVSQRLISLLDQCLVDKKPKIEDGIIPTKLYSINKEVDEENRARLAELPGEVHTLVAEDRWKTKPSKKSMEPIFRSVIDAIIPEEIPLKVGAQVMLLRNRSKGQFGAFAVGSSGPSLVNGSRGKVVAFVESALRPGKRPMYTNAWCIPIYTASEFGSEGSCAGFADFTVFHTLLAISRRRPHPAVGAVRQRHHDDNRAGGVPVQGPRGRRRDPADAGAAQAGLVRFIPSSGFLTVVSFISAVDDMKHIAVVRY